LFAGNKNILAYKHVTKASKLSLSLEKHSAGLSLLLRREMTFRCGGRWWHHRPEFHNSAKLKNFHGFKILFSFPIHFSNYLSKKINDAAQIYSLNSKFLMQK
jgi:hypothetical protein